MTTYALSEPATIRRIAGADSAAGQTDVVARGSLSDCADILETWSEEERATVHIDIDDMALSYGSKEIDQLLEFLRSESAGLSNQEISAIADTDR